MSNYEIININGNHYGLAKYNSETNDLVNKIEVAYHNMRYHLKQHEGQRINDNTFFYRGEKDDHHKMYQKHKREYEQCINTIKEIHRAQKVMGLLRERFEKGREYTHITNDEKCLINRNSKYFTQDNIEFHKAFEFKYNSKDLDIITVTFGSVES